MTKKRKPLNDALAREFVYGTTPHEAEQPQVDTVVQAIPEPTPTEIETIPPSAEPSKPSIMSQLQQVTSKEPIIRLTVDLPESMHRKLSMLAAKTGRKKAEIVRLLLDEAFQELE
ncbi:CopG family transcriptional regulator [Anabaena sp. UHCC 0451]|uniref:CopG family transcriptional regulator n=1 Tax=Anabaena sp. UHCC 0451 TaxID=2055235 RepID=UPI002B216E4D|nr:CopG family transcriptional regulator [Anabaena sp. UHCC 0451]MEA5578717.1 CopG family transcriptional regulator [Anabaena sp. UHCC 0451]